MDDRVRKFLSSRDENILIVYGIRKSGKTSYMKNAIKGRKEKILYYQMKNTNERENFILLKARAENIGQPVKADDMDTIFTEIAKQDERLIIIIENAEILFRFSMKIADTLKKAGWLVRLRYSRRG